MSNVKIRRAFEKRLKLLDGTFRTSYENDKSDTLELPYQNVRLLSGPPDDPNFGSTYFRENGIFQIMLNYPKGDGMKDCAEKAEQIRQHFKRGTSMLEDGLVVEVMRTPEIHSGGSEDGKYKLPISITYFAQAAN